MVVIASICCRWELPFLFVLQLNTLPVLHYLIHYWYSWVKFFSRKSMWLYQCFFALSDNHQFYICFKCMIFIVFQYNGNVYITILVLISFGIRPKKPCFSKIQF